MAYPKALKELPEMVNWSEIQEVYVAKDLPLKSTIKQR
jgi:hypothetical protein